MSDDERDILRQLVEQVQAVDSRTARMERVMIGDEEPARGLLFRVTLNEKRLGEIEDRDRRRLGLLWAAVTSGGGAVLVTLWKLVTGQG